MNNIENVIKQLERQKAAIDKAITALREVGDVTVQQSSATKGTATQASRKRRISSEGRKRIAEAMRRRWATKRAAEKASSRGAGPRKNVHATKKKEA